MNSLISPDDHWVIWTFLVGTAALSLYLEQRYRFVKRVTGAAVAICAGIFVSNIGLLPSESPSYDVVWNYIVPLVIPLLLMKTDVRTIFKETGRFAGAFHISALDTMIGCEEPIAHWNNRDLVRVRNNSPVSIMADESVFSHHDAFRLASMGACDYFNIKLSKTGGINNALKVIAIGEAAGIKSQVSCMSESRYALTALSHLVAARNNIVHFDIDSSFTHAEDPVIGGIQYKGKGKWELPDSPGIGADFDTGFLDKMEKANIS